MKTHIVSLITALCLSASTLFAGPVESKILDGAGRTFDVRQGQVMEIFNLIDTDETQARSSLTVTIGGNTATVLRSNFANADTVTPAGNGRTVVIAGPALVTLTVDAAQTAFITYKQ
jgi:hypothetical protein